MFLIREEIGLIKNGENTISSFKTFIIMSNINFTGNPQQAIAATGGILTAIATAPAWLLAAGATAVAVGVGVAIHEATKKDGK